MLTVTTMTGTNAIVGELAARYPDATLEAMEDLGATLAAELLDVPVIQVRAVSDFAGARDLCESTWGGDTAHRSLKSVLPARNGA